jgi:hypothetical protein
MMKFYQQQQQGGDEGAAPGGFQVLVPLPVPLP